MPKAALILPSYYEAIKDLPDADRLALYDCLVRYGLYGDEIELPLHLKGYFILMKPSIDTSRSRYDAAHANGSKGGAPKGNQNARKKQPENNQTNNQDSDYEEEKDLEEKEIDSIKADKPPRAARFVPPTVEEVAEYCRERGNHIDAQAFVDHYQANGWKRGKNKVQDWRACVRTWEREDKQKPAAGKHYDYSNTEGSL